MEALYRGHCRFCAEAPSEHRRADCLLGLLLSKVATSWGNHDVHTLDDGSALAGGRQLSDRAGEFRIILSARQEADAILADATEVRRDAGLRAELLVAAAEALSRDLADQATSGRDQAIGEARERA